MSKYVSKTSSFCRDGVPFTASSYLVVDIGGGTVDISAHHLSSNPEPHISVIHPPEGNACGGTKVNREFEIFLQKLVGDKDFSQFLPTDNDALHAKNSVYVNELVNINFEIQKILFAGETAENCSSRYMIELPYRFVEHYRHDLREGITREGESAVQLVDQDLRISHEQMETFFEPVKKGILECIRGILADLSQIEKIYLVGGFGGCEYLYQCIQNEFKSKYDIVVPVKPAYAVVRGAALFKQNPSLVKSRKVDATYGLATNHSFINGLHDPDYKWIDDDGRLLCKNLFSTIVERGDIVRSGQVFFDTFYPPYHKQTEMAFCFYSSQEKNVFYVTGKRGGNSNKKDHCTVSKIGEVIIKMPDLTGDKKRAVDVTFDFSHTEIQVKAFDRTSKNDVKIVLNFLTSI